MQYLASHYWHSANENSPSLLLQQVYHKQKELTVLLACVCSNGGNSISGKRMVTGLADWFYEIGLPFVDRKGTKGISKLGRLLEYYLNQPQNSMEEICMSGLFCVGSSLFLWKRGGAKLWLLNEKKLEAHILELFPEKEGERGLVFRRGCIQRNVGVLLSTEFCGQPEPMKVKNGQEYNQMENYLRELGSEAAILVMTK